MTYHIIENKKKKKLERAQVYKQLSELFIRSKSIDEFKVNADIKNLPKFKTLELVFFYYTWQLKNEIATLTFAIAIPLSIFALELREYVSPTQTHGCLVHMYGMAFFGGCIIGASIGAVLVLVFMCTLNQIKNNFSIDV